MKKQRVFWICSILAIIIGFLFVIPLSRPWLLGIVRMERFYAGRPANYWIEALVERPPNPPEPLPILERLRALVSPLPQHTHFSQPKEPCPVSLPILIDMLSDRNLELRYRAAWVLWHRLPLPPETVPALLRCMADPNSSVRAMAGTTVSNCAEWTPEIQNALLSLLSDPDMNVRERISRCFILGEQKRRQAYPALVAVRASARKWTAHAAKALEYIERDAATEGGVELAQLRGTFGPNKNPQWCYNTLTITGPPRVVDAFVRKARGKQPAFPGTGSNAESKEHDLSFNSLEPVPGKIVHADFLPKGFEWEIENWGCPSEALYSRLEIVHSRQVRYEFLTAWGPPNALIGKMSWKFDALHFKNEWETPELGFEGMYTWGLSCGGYALPVEKGIAPRNR